MIDPKAAARKTVIEKVMVIRHRPGEALFPKALFEDGKPQVDVWAVLTTVRTGLKPSETKAHYYLSEEEANAFAEKHPAGSILPDLTAPERDVDLVRSILDSSLQFGISAGDEESPLAYDVLVDAGIHDERYGRTSQKVLDFVGEERVAKFKSRYGDNWSVAAEFEYAMLRLPFTSPAFVAASYRYHHYITGDDFTAGYLWRDLEVLVHGVEAKAANAIERGKRAGAGGSKKSIEARTARRHSLMDAIEYIANRMPMPSSLVKMLFAASH